ncbi:hypothetical protein QBC35DRAFT_480063 [Podospora australis]|uniref:SigF-like NTF2-like domain-containing protein n=1 Tax=Podospora australis TaxID=1536484 RepID=A0AAN6X448_9PEZI|nr:hypothetical protein QBC35DRAFT_480063 [Podospora australis]
MEHPVRDVKNIIRSLTQGSPDEQLDAVYRYFAPGASFVHPFCRVPSFKNVQVPGLGETDSRALIAAVLKWYKILSPRIDLDIVSTVFDQKTNTLYVKINQVFSIWFIPFHRAPVQLVTVLQLEPVTSDGTSASSNGSAQQQQPKMINGKAEKHDEENPRETLYDAAEETRHLIQEGEAPSFSEVAAGEASAESLSPITQSPDMEKIKERSSGNGNGSSSSGGSTKYLITKQEDLYQVNEFLKFLAMAPGAGIYIAWQLFATFLCLLGVGVLGPVMRVVGGKVAQHEGRQRIGEGLKH